MQTDPPISVIIPTYNRANRIPGTIQSVLDQEHRDFELIVVDDGSTDRTEEVVRGFQDPRISYVKVTNGERGRARNEGARRAKGDFICFLDSDDLLYTNHLSTALDFISSREPAVFWLPAEVVDPEGRVTGPYRASKKPILQRLVHEGNFMFINGVFVRREVALSHPFNEDRDLAGSEDLELWIRLAARYPILIGQDVTSCVVDHEGRSVLGFDDLAKLIRRKELMIQYLKEDPVVRDRISGKMHVLMASAESYVALHCLLNPKTPARAGWKFFFRSLRRNPGSAFSRRSMAIVKHGIKRALSRGM